MLKSHSNDALDGDDEEEDEEDEAEEEEDDDDERDLGLSIILRGRDDEG